MEKKFRKSIAQFVEYCGRRKTPRFISFADDKVSTPLEQLTIPYWGKYLQLPPSTAAVLYDPDGNPKVRLRGGFLNLIPGEYGCKYIDMSQRLIKLLNIKANSQDAWPVSLDVEIIWRVSSPLLIANTKDPFHNLEDICKSAVINFIHACLHDELVSAPDVQPIEEHVIAQGILDLLNANRAIQGFQIISINILNRSGDTQRLEKSHQALVKVEELKRKQDITREELAVVQEEQRVEIAKTETNQLKAKTQAEYEAKIAKILKPVQEQTVRIEQLGKTQSLEQDRIMEAIKMLRDAFSMVSQIQMTPGLQHNVDKQTIETMMNLFNAILSTSPSKTNTKKNMDDQDGPRILPAFDE